MADIIIGKIMAIWQIIVTLKGTFLDIDGFGSFDEYGQLLVEYKRRHAKVTDTTHSANCFAGKKYSRRILSAIWDYIVSIITKIVFYHASEESTTKFGVLLGTKSSKSSKFFLKDLQKNNIQILTFLLKLSRKVGFQNLTGSIFCILSNIVCSKSEMKHKQIKIGPEIFLALDSILDNGLELASHSQDCWKHIFKCCQFISNIEEIVVKSNTISSPRVEKISNLKTRRSLEVNFDSRSQSEEIWLGFIGKPEKNQYENMTHILQEYKSNLKSDVLSGEVLTKCVNLLVYKIEKLFSDASSHLNLMSFLGYLRELCFQSHKELILLNSKNMFMKGLKSQETFYINQLSEAMLKCIRYIC